MRYQGPYVYVDGLILSVTRNIGKVEVNHHDRYAGDSGYSFKKSLSLWLKMATNFSIVPLCITSFVGICFSGLGFLLVILLIIQKFTLDLMPIGWSSLIVTILIVGGVQLLALGMVGEYLDRVLLTLNSRPQYVIGETTGMQPPTPRSSFAQGRLMQFFLYLRTWGWRARLSQCRRKPACTSTAATGACRLQWICYASSRMAAGGIHFGVGDIVCWSVNVLPPVIPLSSVPGR